MRTQPGETRRTWLDQSAVSRWHFYAGLFCLPFFCWLALTGSVYLFRPDIEAFLDRPYEGLHFDGPRAPPSSEARAAAAALPGAAFSRYEPAATPTGAAQVVVARDGRLFRVYVHPVTLQAMHIVQDDHRLMELIAHLHGQLLLGDRGSMTVELAGSWGVVMILSGLYLWLPRGHWRLGGVFYPRLRQRGRTFWRELHSVTGVWVSVVTLLLLLSGLPWAVTWGNYLSWARSHWVATAGTPDWPIGGQDPPVPRAIASSAASGGMPGMTASGRGSQFAERPPVDVHALDILVPVAARLEVPRPVWVSPPAPGVRDWTISSHIQNRPLRVTYSVAPETGVVTGTERFGTLNIVDKVVNIAIATHEGQLFGRLNQAILLLNAAALVLLTASAAVMWWRRRPAHTLGAPPPAARRPFPALLAVVIIALAVLLPLFGLSLLLVLAVERLVLQHIPAAQRWLGLAPPAV